jgi:hypothetical protein
MGQTKRSKDYISKRAMEAAELELRAEDMKRKEAEEDYRKGHPEDYGGPPWPRRMPTPKDPYVNAQRKKRAKSDSREGK